MESIARISTLLENGLLPAYHYNQTSCADADPSTTARELTLDAASAARSSRSSSRPLDRTQVKKLLDSRNEREVLDGLRRVISVRRSFHILAAHPSFPFSNRPLPR
jgi:hypothetical protein